MTIVDQRPTGGEQPERPQLLGRDAVADRVGPPSPAALSGCVLIGTAAVASRLLPQERLHAIGSAAIEAAQEGLLVVEPHPVRGARAATVFGLASAVAVLLIAACL
jgi:hypothetical protein